MKIMNNKVFKFCVKAIIWISLTIIAFIIRDIYTNTKQSLSTEPYVAVVAVEGAPDFTIPEEFKQGFEIASAAKNRMYIESRGSIVSIQYKSDLGSETQAVKVANELVSDPNCIMVIGNSTSTLTDITLDVFLKSGNPPTYILPIATANEIIAKAKTAKFSAILRMVPDNANQANTVQALVSQLAPTQRIAIYGDQENEFYSVNLCRDISSKIRKNGGRILIEELLGPTSSFYTTISQWTNKTKRPEVIIYAGVAHHGLLLIDQLSENNISVPVIFTDGCMVSSLLENIYKLKGRAFVISPNTIQGEDKMPTYEPIGQDAYAIASLILNDCKSRTREGVREYVSENKEKIQIDQGVAGKYHFNADGNNIGMNYMYS